MPDLVQFTLEDGTKVLFEAADTDSVVLHGAERSGAGEGGGGRLSEQLEGIARAAQQVASAMRAQLAPDKVSLELGVKVAGELQAWFFAKSQAESTIKVTLTWEKGSPSNGLSSSGVTPETSVSPTPNASAS